METPYIINIQELMCLITCMSYFFVCLRKIGMERVYSFEFIA